MNLIDSKYRTNGYLIGLLLATSLLALFACKAENELVARYAVSVRAEGNEKAKRVTWLSKAEQVTVLAEQGNFTQVKLAGGKEGFVDSKALAKQALVITDDDMELKRRPSLSTGNSSSAKNMHKASVAFEIERVQNDEGIWLHIIGGSGSNKAFPYFDGWIKEGHGYDTTLSLVRSAIELEQAAQKRDLTQLKDLVGKPEPVNEAAAALVVEIEGVKEEPLAEDQEVAPETETPQTNESASEAGTTGTDQSNTETNN